MMHKWIKHITIFLFLLLLSLSGNSQDNNLSNLSVVVEFKSEPISVNIIHTPLRYNKNFALSYTLDDGLKNGYTHAYKFISGGIVDGTDYDPLYYTDGCGNDINFAMSAAISSLSGDLTEDYHDPNTPFANIYLTWPQINEMYQGGWGVFNHGLSTATNNDIDYLVARNHSFIRRKTQDATPGGIYPSVIVCPSGNELFASPAFNQGYNASYRGYSYGIDYLNVFTPSAIIQLDSLRMGRRLLAAATDLSGYADDLYVASTANSITTPWSSVFGHNVIGNYGEYSFNTFKLHLQYIADTYGKEGLDNIWFTTEEEVLDYVLTKDAITANRLTVGKEILITFTGNLPDDLRTYALSLSVQGSVNDTITSITIDGESFSSYSELNDTGILINLEWDGSDLPSILETANFWVDSAELVNSQNVSNIAMDYVRILETGPVKDDLRYRLCNISSVTMPDDLCIFCSTSIGTDKTICYGECTQLTVPGGVSYIWSTGETTQSITVCPEVTTEYTVKVINDENCEARDTLNVTVIPLPIVQTSNDTAICHNDCVEIWANGGNTYLWSTGETTDTITVCPSEATKYYVTAYNTYGCETIDSVFVDLHPVIIADAGKDVNLYQGGCTTLYASGGSTYEWSSGDLTLSTEVCPVETTKYYVTAFSDYGCNDTDSVMVILRTPHEIGSATVGINSVAVIFESNPTYLNIYKTPLKYNKEFALSFHISNANKDIYTHAFPYLNGGSVEGVSYPGLTFTDGCDNAVNFKMGTSLYSYAADGFTDIHDPAGASADDFIIWTEAAELYQAGWGLFSQGVLPDNSGDQYYSIARNHSFVKFKTHELISGGIPMNVLMNPEGDNTFTTPAFVQNYRASYSSYTEGIPYYDIRLIPNSDSLKMGSNSMDNQQSIATLADLIHNNYDPNTRLWASANLSTITDGSIKGYSFSVFRFYMNYIENKYGTSGLDNVWMTSEEEVWDYLTNYDLITIHQEILDDRLLITFSGNLPAHLNNYALSLLVESDANIQSIEVNGGNNNTYKIKADTSALINLNWDGAIQIADTIQAENYVVIAEANRTTNDALVAMDYVNMLDSGSKKDELRERLCAITEATLPLGYCSCEFSIGNDTIICKDDCIDLTVALGESYLWSTGESVQNIEVCPSDTTQYWVTVYNQYDCYYTDTIQVNVNPDNFAVATLDTTICDLSCVDLTVSAGAEYLWSTGDTTQTINVCPDVETEYYIDVTNAIGCVSRDSVTVSLNELPTAIISDDVSICEYDSTVLRISGGTRYYWSNTATSDTIKVSPADTTKYFVWVYNENDCQVLDSVTVNVIPLPLAEAGIDTAICFEDCVTLTASGGFTYEWDTNETSSSIDVCPDDTTTYYVTVKDQYSCASTDSVKVFVNPVPETQTSNDTIVCPNQCIKIWASGGSSYLWDTGETTDTITICPSEVTKYYVSVFNDLDCATIDSVFVDLYPSTNAIASDDISICPGDCTSLIATGGYIYEWNTGAETNSIDVCPDVTTQYYVTVYNEYDCPATDSVWVTLRTPPTINAGNDTTKCVTDCIQLKATGGESYSWSNGIDTRINEVCPSIETKYFVTGTDEFGCSSIDSVLVGINDYPEVSLLGLLPVYCENASAILLEGSPDNGAFGGGGVSGNIFSPANAGIGNHQVYYSIVDNTGCAIGDTVDIIINKIPDFSLGNDTTLCTDETLEIFLPDDFDQYLWSNGQIDGWYFYVHISKFEVGTTDLEVIVTDNGCVAKDTIGITYESCNVGIEDLEGIGINIYPNPSSGIITIEYNGTEENQFFSIYNMQGQEIYTEELNECRENKCNKTLDVTFLNKGAYLIRFYNNRGVRTGKLFIQ